MTIAIKKLIATYNIAKELYLSSLYNDANLISYFRFEADSSDSKALYNGTDTSISYSAAKFGNGAVLNGTSSHILFGNPVMPKGAKTVSFWMKSNKTSDYQHIASNARWETGGTYGTVLWIEITTGIFHFQCMANTTLFDVKSTRLVCDNAWHLVSCVWDGTTTANAVKLYIDGRLEAQGTSSATETTNQSYNMNIGNLVAGGAYYWYGGTLDDFAVFSRALTASEIFNLYNSNIKRFAGLSNLENVEFSKNLLLSDASLQGYYKLENGALGTDSSGKGRTLTAVASPTSVSGKFGGGLSIAGANYYQRSDAMSLTKDNWGISYWVKANSLSSYQILGVYVGNASTNGFGTFQANAAGGAAGDYLGFLFGGVVVGMSANRILDTTDFHHIVLTRDTVTTRMYIDGVLIYAANPTAPVNPVATFSLYADSAGCIIDDVAIFSRLLTQTDVTNIYNSSKIKKIEAISNI